MKLSDEEVIARQVYELRHGGERGGRPLLLVGAPGTGKVRWARAWAERLSSWRECEPDIAAIRRVAGLGQLPADELLMGGPFRAPHHTVSAVGMTGKLGRGYDLRPGELSLAHGGTLFLDEAPEFRRGIVDMVAGVFRLGRVCLSSPYQAEGQARETARVYVPARFSLVMAANPCACGYQGSGARECVCSAATRARYRERLDWLALGALVLVPDSGGYRPGELPGVV